MQCFSKPVGVVAAIPEQPLDVGQAAQHRPRADVVAHLSGGDEQIDRSPLTSLNMCFNIEAYLYTSQKPIYVNHRRRTFGVKYMSHTVRLQDFAKIVGRDRDALRTEEQRENAPWGKEDFPEAGKQRRYSGFHALAMVTREQLASQGLHMAEASEFVRVYGHSLRKFLSDITTQTGAEKTLIPAFYKGIFCDLAGFNWEPVQLSGSPSVKEIEREFSSLLREVGTNRTYGKLGNKITERVVCGPMVAIADLHEAYRMAQSRALSGGFVLYGFDLAPRSGDDA